MEQRYNIFISYRRDGGEATGKIICDKLTGRGYRVFFDVESLRSGDFNTELYSVIDGCDDFLLILSPGALDRCWNDKDWVRLEIEHAVSAGRNIIPIMLRGFTFPEKLPESIDVIRYKNGLESNYQFFDAFMEKLESFLRAERQKKRFGKGKWLVGLGLAVPVAAAAVLAFGGGQPEVYPRTAAEQNVTKEFLYYTQLNLQELEQAAEYLNRSYEACDQYLLHADTADRDELLAEFKKNRSFLYQMNMETSQLSAELRQDIMDSPFSAADADAMHDYLVSFRDSCIDTIYYMEYLTDPENYIEPEVKADILKNYREILSEEAKYMAYATNLLLLPVSNQKTLESFKYDFLPQLYYIPLEASSWSSDEAALISAEDKSWNTISRIMDRITIRVGEDNMRLMEKKSELIEQMVREGSTEEEARRSVEALSGKVDLLTAKEADLAELRQELEEKLEYAKVKFAPAAGDDGDILWGKMLRFLNLGLYDEAVACVDAYREAEWDNDEYIAEYCAAAVRFINGIGQTGIDYGLMVVGYEPGRPRNEQYQIGDVIIGIDGKVCHNFEEYDSLRKALGEGEDYYVSVLRAKEGGSGELEQLRLMIPGDSSRVQTREMTEKDY